jgi:RNA polymerase sigma-B factor
VNAWSADITEALFVRYTDSRDIETRNEIVERYSPLAAKAASRYMRPGLEYDDLYQVAMMSLLRAIERFDSSKGVKFAAFALPTLLGDLKHYIRDYSSAMRPPRSAGELAAKLRRAESELAGQLGRYPTTEETADYVGVSVERALEALETANSLQFMMIDGAENQDGEAMETILGSEDSGYQEVVNRETVRAVLEGLNDNDRRLVVCRYINGMTQAEIAREMGITQMTVSRMERRIIESLKKKHGG